MSLVAVDIKLRKTWFIALCRIRDFGAEPFVVSLKYRSSTIQMLRRLVGCGYLTPPPYRITKLGLRYISHCQGYYRWNDPT